VGEIFADKFPSIDLQPILDLVTIEAKLHVSEDLLEQTAIKGKGKLMFALPKVHFI
jgi:hypothetical protein